MGYATQLDLTDRFGAVELAQLTDRADGMVIEAAVVARALSDADAEIDAYLGARYALPLASVPPVLTRLACDMARYHLYADRVIDVVRARYQDAVSLLKRMATGEVELPAATLLAAAGSGVAVLARTRAKAFDADSLGTY